ncbi:Hypothetical predicted protein [Olea europaea subsp. europaea]|uniref:Uncharacterized protein n=1 Tax=Olea europaea subsp. europaea TaxID=158383 RepID=A0A8S0Q3E8_OLEEU|nr:Hypothetical predicted protein [Olea europaea subsp. europaea]
MTPDIPRIRERESKQEEAGESESQRETELRRKVERESSAAFSVISNEGKFIATAIYYIASTICVIQVVIWATAAGSTKSVAMLTIKKWFYPPICKALT